jgi:hypothetical protein
MTTTLAAQGSQIDVTGNNEIRTSPTSLVRVRDSIRTFQSFEMLDQKKGGTFKE